MWRRSAGSRAYLLAAVLAVACGGREGVAPPEGAAAPRFETATTRAGAYAVGWRPVGGPPEGSVEGSVAGKVPLNEPFDVEVRVRRAAASGEGVGEPVTGAQVFVRCDMPAHGHGMNVEPVGRELGDGLYRVEGLLLHMAGRWVLGVDVVVAGTAETADFELHLE